MDTRDQTLTKLTWLHDKSHPTHHRPASLRWNYSRTAVSIMKLVMEDGWWWRRRRIPLSEPRTDSRSALPREIRAWRRLRVVKCDETFSLIFSPQTWIYGVGVEVGGGPGGPRDRGCALQGGTPLSRGQALGPLMYFFRPEILINSKMCLCGFSGHSENLCFLHNK